MARSLLCPLVALMLAASHAAAAPAADSGIPAQALAAEVAANNTMQHNLEELCDDIGPRMTGTAGLLRAQEWAMRKLNAYGATNVRLEPYHLGRPWRRGSASARLLNANGMRLNVLQKAWTDGTRGILRAEVALLDTRSLAGFNAALPHLKGKIVLLENWPREAPAHALRAAGVAAVLEVSGKESGLQDMWGGPGQRIGSSAGIITREHAAMLKRLLARGAKPRLELSMQGRFAEKAVQAHNVVADFPGSDAAGEIVLLGAHLDSWDLSCSAADNGAGVVAMLEVLRAMRAAGMQPRRTLRIALFSGEEQGLLGSKAYVEAHRAELPDIQAVLVQDAGGGRILGFPDMQVEAWYAALTAALAPAQAISSIDVHYAIGLGSDQETFFRNGVPAFAPLQDSHNYFTHAQHSQADTPEQVDPAALRQAAQVMALLAWGLLNGERLPHAVRTPPPAPPSAEHPAPPPR